MIYHSLKNQNTPLNSLRRQWLKIGAGWTAVTLAFYLLLKPSLPHPSRWLLFTTLGLAFGLRVLWRGLPENHRAGETELLPTLGAGNQLSLMRGLCLSLLAGFLFSPWPQGPVAWLIVALYTLASIADHLDGFLARRANHMTLLGGRLDMEFDGFGVVIVTLLAVGYGQLPWWYLSVGLARYLFIWGLWWRKRQHKAIFEMPDSVHRRLVAGVQMGLMSAVLWPIMPPAMSRIIGTVVAIPTLLGFLRDWLVVNGRFRPQTPSYQRIQQDLYKITARYFPPIGRLILAVSMGIIYQSIPHRLQPQAWLGLLQSWHLPNFLASFLAVVLGIVGILGVILILSGIVVRFAAIALIFPIGFDIATRGLMWENGIALVCTIALLILGGGLWTLWKPDDFLMMVPRGIR